MRACSQNADFGCLESGRLGAIYEAAPILLFADRGDGFPLIVVSSPPPMNDPGPAGSFTFSVAKAVRRSVSELGARSDTRSDASARFGPPVRKMVTSS